MRRKTSEKLVCQHAEIRCSNCNRLFVRLYEYHEHKLNCDG